MLPTAHCHRCGYANAPSWARCCCCGRPVGDHHVPRGTRVVRAPASRRSRPAHAKPRTPTRAGVALGTLGTLVAPAASLAAVAGAWLGPVTPDERAGLLTAAAAVSTFATLRTPTQRVPDAALRSDQGVIRHHSSSKEKWGGERVEDLAALIAAW
jgi:hypothetical protein